MNNYVLIKVVGKNVNNYLSWLLNKRIDIIDLNVVNHNELRLVTDYKYYSILTKYSKTYKVTIIQKYGKLRFFEIIKSNKLIIISIVISLCFIYLLSQIIFSVDIMYNDEKVVKMVNKELARYGIKKYGYKKDFDYLNKVKNKILTDNKDTLEWLEIEQSGTKYIVRLVERKKETKPIEYKYQSIVASKNATINNIKAFSGEKTKSNNDYVKKGDIIISGIITKTDGTNIYTQAKGIVTGEVWYLISVEYPLYYQEEKLTGRNKTILSIYFLNYEIPLLPYKKYKQFKRHSNIVAENNFIPFKITKEKLYEVNIIEDIYTSETAVEKAIYEAKNKLKTQNNKIIAIKDIKVINKTNLNSKIKLDLFISTIEDVTEVIEIKEEIVEN